MSDGAFAKGVIRPALFVSGCVFLGLLLFFTFLLAMTLTSALFDQDFAGEIFGYSPADFAAYLLCAIAFGGYGLATLRASGVRWVREIPLLGAASTKVLVLVGVVASLPIVLTIALIVSIILDGGLD